MLFRFFAKTKICFRKFVYSGISIAPNLNCAKLVAPTQELRTTVEKFQN